LKVCPAFSGLLGFIGLVVPHIMRRLVGEESGVLLVSSALGGAVFVVICDLLARVVAAPFVIPVGIVLSFTGAPFFLWLLFKQRGGRI
jgi:iron complex transport system permease protein